MSNGVKTPPSIVLLGEEEEAAEWIPFAVKQLDALPEHQMFANFAPAPETTIRISQHGEMYRIEIEVLPPPGASFAGVAHDRKHYKSWGYPFNTKFQQVTSLGIPYGTVGARNYAREIKIEGDDARWAALRYPQYSQHLPDGIRHGNIDWQGGKAVLSWHGLPSRHRMFLPSDGDWFENAMAGWPQGQPLDGSTCVPSRYAYIGVCTTGANQCEIDPLLNPDAYWDTAPSGMKRVVIPRSQTLTADQSGYSWEDVLQRYVFQNGEVLFEAKDDRLVAGACIHIHKDDNGDVVYNEFGRPKRTLRVVEAKFDYNRGVYREYLSSCNYNYAVSSEGSEVRTQESLDYSITEIMAYGNENVELNYINNKYLDPVINSWNWTLNSDGTKGAAIRRTYTGSSYDDVVISISIDDKNQVTTTYLWKLSVDAPKWEIKHDVSENIERRFERKLEGKHPIAVEYVGDELHYAYVNTRSSQSYLELLTDRESPVCDSLDSSGEKSTNQYITFTIDGESSQTPILDYHIETHQYYNEDKENKSVFSQHNMRFDEYSPISIDARAGLVITARNLPGSWYYELTRDYNSGWKTMTNVQPNPHIEERGISVFLLGNLIEATDKFEIESEFGYADNYSAETGSCGLTTYSTPDPDWVLSAADVGEVALDFDQWLPSGFGYISCRTVSEDVVDIVYSAARGHPDYDTVGKLMRYNKRTGEITATYTIAEMLEIGGDYKPSPSDRAMFAPNGLL